MKDNSVNGGAFASESPLDGLTGGLSLGTLHEQRFFAIRANGPEIRFPFPSGPFKALIDMARPVDENILRCYAKALIDHGCVQAVCRGVDSGELDTIFYSFAEKGDLDKSGVLFTSMCLDDEPLAEAIQYFALPCGLAQTGLLMVIGDQGDFQQAIKNFSVAAGAIKENIGEPVYTEDDLVCFVSS